MKVFQINTTFTRTTGVLLSVILFAVCSGAYLWISHERHQGNPADKIVPTLKQLADGAYRATFEKDRKGEYRLWVDTIASGRRFFIGLACLAFAVLFGLHMGVFPVFEKFFLSFMLFADKVNPLSLLPILFIILGLGETAKISLIVVGVLPTIVLDTYLRAKAVPQEQLIKALTLDASDLEVAYKVVLPQIFPKVLDTIRLNFKTMIIFLIAGEAIAAKAGLGYRIFVVRRYIAMDIIIPYVLWMSLLAFAMDFMVRLWIAKRYPWLNQE